MNLFIIGNGFDLAHNIKSSYKDFKSYLANKETSIFYEAHFPIKDMYGYHGIDPYDGLRIVELAIELAANDPDWKDFEEALGELHLEIFLEQYSNGKNDQWVENENGERINALFKSAENIKQIFAEWVEQIDIKKEKIEKFAKLISPTDLVLTFNYTHTIEELYGISQNILHIHGDTCKDIIVGHGKKENYNAIIDEIIPKSSLGLNDIHEKLRKKTERVLAKKDVMSFLGKIRDSNIKKVYSFGFSYGDIDKPYIEAVSNCLSNDTVWLFNNFNESKIPSFKEKVKKAGFKGTFDTFSTEHPKEV